MSASAWREGEGREHQSLGAAWLHALGQVLDRGRDVWDHDERLIELLNLLLVIQDVSYDEVLQKYADSGRIDLMRRKYQSRERLPQYPLSYGRLLYDREGIDQIQWIIDRMRNNPATKSATIGFHPPGRQQLSCVSLLDFKLRGGQLTMTAIYRSQNVFASQPGNVLALRAVQERVSAALGERAGPFVLHVLSAHVYARDLAAARHVLAAAAAQGIPQPVTQGELAW